MLPPSAGVRAERRVRPGVSLSARGWLAALCALLPALAAAALFLQTPAPTPLTAIAAPTLDDIDALANQAREAQTIGREQTRGLLAVAAQQIAQSAPVPSADDAEPVDPLPALRKALDELTRANPTLRSALIDRAGSVVYATGDLPREAPAFKSAVAALIAGDALPALQTGAISKARGDGLRVALLASAPGVDDAAIANALGARKQAQERLQQTTAQLTTQAAQADLLWQSWLLATASVAATALFTLIAIVLLLLRPLRQAVGHLLLRASERAAGGQNSAQTTLPGELAAVDDLVGRAFDAVAMQSVDVRERVVLERALGELAETCRRAAAGDLAARAEPPPGPAGTLAMDLNLLIESVERRALRMRGHLTAPANAATTPAAADLDNLRQRSAALNPMAQLLADIASRLQLFAATAGRGEPIETDLKKLGDAVAARSKTARAYLSALNDAIGELASNPAAGARLQRMLEQELATLQLETTFPRLIEANRDQSLDEIKRRIDAEHKPGTAAPTDAE